MDDEYVWAGVEDPKIVITTSHNPSSRLKQFAKVVSALLIISQWVFNFFLNCAFSVNQIHVLIVID